MPRAHPLERGFEGPFHVLSQWDEILLSRTPALYHTKVRVLLRLELELELAFFQCQCQSQLHLPAHRALPSTAHRRLLNLMGLLGWEIGPDFPVGLAWLGLHGTPRTRCSPCVSGDSEASTKETQGQEEAQKVDALAVLWQVSLSM